jgi:hypothetical protein
MEQHNDGIFSISSSGDGNRKGLRMCGLAVLQTTHHGVIWDMHVFSVVLFCSTVPKGKGGEVFDK